MCANTFETFGPRDFPHFAMVNFAEGQAKPKRSLGKVFKFPNYVRGMEGGRWGSDWTFGWAAK